ncbi:MAG: site-specific integrase [Clostridiaceae bacterium]|nr:site-specific integrase [Clostridiaceae bacterium]
MKENKKPKRENGEGTITQLPNGTYMGKIQIDGIRKSVYGKSKPEVIRKIQQLSVNSLKGLKESSSMKLENWLLFWLENYKKLKLKPKTYEVYETQSKYHILPSLGDIKLKDLNSLQIQKYINKKAETLSSATVRKQYNILKSCLEKAVANEMINKNPCNHIELPALNQKEIKAFTQEEEKKFLEFAKHDPLYPLFIVALDTGIRLGELLALTWSDIDFKSAEIRVNKNLIFVRNYEGKTKNKNILKVQDTPKSKSSNRTVPLTTRSLYLLQKLKSDRILVFCTKTNNYLSPRNVERSFVRIAGKAGINDCNFHSLRHTYATRLFELGVPLNVVSKLLGHSKTSITSDIYISVIPQLKTDAVKVLDSLHHSTLNHNPFTTHSQPIEDNFSYF